jgi:hypothetical protein
MTTPLSHLEIQLIRSSLLTKTDEELSSLLDRPAEEIATVVLNLCEGNLDERISSLQQVSEKKLIPIKSRKRLENERKEAKLEENRRDLAIRSNIELRRRKERTAWEERRSFKTKSVDLSELVAVKIDSKTTVFVKPGTNIAKVKEQYQRKPLLNEQSSNKQQ